MTERLRMLIHISNYFQTLEIMEKTLSDKNEPYNKAKSALSPLCPEIEGPIV